MVVSPTAGASNNIKQTQPNLLAASAVMAPHSPRELYAACRARLALGAAPAASPRAGDAPRRGRPPRVLPVDALVRAVRGEGAVVEAPSAGRPQALYHLPGRPPCCCCCPCRAAAPRSQAVHAAGVHSRRSRWDRELHILVVAHVACCCLIPGPTSNQNRPASRRQDFRGARAGERFTHIPKLSLFLGAMPPGDRASSPTYGYCMTYIGRSFAKYMPYP